MIQVLVDSYVVAQFATFDEARNAAILIERAFVSGNTWEVDDDARFAVGPYWRAILTPANPRWPHVVIEAGEFDMVNGAIPAPPAHYLARVREGLRGLTIAVRDGSKPPTVTA